LKKSKGETKGRNSAGACLGGGGGGGRGSNRKRTAKGRVTNSEKDKATVGKGNLGVTNGGPQKTGGWRWGKKKLGNRVGVGGKWRFAQTKTTKQGGVNGPRVACETLKKSQVKKKRFGFMRTQGKISQEADGSGSNRN